MSTRTFKNAFFEFTAVDLSAHVRSVSLTPTKDSPEETAMGDDSREFRPDGLRNATITVEWNSDDAAGAVSATLWAHYIADTLGAFEIRPSQAAVGVTNPKYTGNAVLTSDVPVGGSVGDLQTGSSTFQVSGDVTRATA